MRLLTHVALNDLSIHELAVRRVRGFEISSIGMSTAFKLIH
jgi:hypothetical protein